MLIIFMAGTDNNLRLRCSSLFTTGSCVMNELQQPPARTIVAATNLHVKCPLSVNFITEPGEIKQMQFIRKLNTRGFAAPAVHNLTT